MGAGRERDLSTAGSLSREPYQQLGTLSGSPTWASRTQVLLSHLTGVLDWKWTGWIPMIVPIITGHPISLKLSAVNWSLGALMVCVRDSSRTLQMHVDSEDLSLGPETMDSSSSHMLIDSVGWALNVSTYKLLCGVIPPGFL